MKQQKIKNVIKIERKFFTSLSFDESDEINKMIR